MSTFDLSGTNFVMRPAAPKLSASASLSSLRSKPQLQTTPTLHASATQTSIGMRSLRPAPSPVVLSKNRAIQYGVPHVSLARPFSSKQINEVKQQLQQLDSPVSKSEFLSWNHDHKLSSINNASTLHSTFNYDTAFDQFDETITQTQYRPSTSNTSQTNKRQSLNVNSESNLQTLLSERRSGCLDSSQFLRQARLSCAQRAADFCNEERVYFPLKAQTLESIFEDYDQVLNECTALFQSVEPSRAATPKSNQNPSSSNVSQRRLRELEQELLEARQEIESNEKRHQNTLAMWRSELDKYRGLVYVKLGLDSLDNMTLPQALDKLSEGKVRPQASPAIRGFRDSNLPSTPSPSHNRPDSVAKLDIDADETNATQSVRYGFAPVRVLNGSTPVAPQPTNQKHDLLNEHINSSPQQRQELRNKLLAIDLRGPDALADIIATTAMGQLDLISRPASALPQPSPPRASPKTVVPLFQQVDVLPVAPPQSSSSPQTNQKSQMAPAASGPDLLVLLGATDPSTDFGFLIPSKLSG